MEVALEEYYRLLTENVKKKEVLRNEWFETDKNTIC